MTRLHCDICDAVVDRKQQHARMVTFRESTVVLEINITGPPILRMPTEWHLCEVHLRELMRQVFNFPANGEPRPKKKGKA